MSVTETKQAIRKVTICVKKDCMRCPLSEVHVPDDCEWSLKHVLCTQEEGRVIDMPRRSGKTTRVVNLAVNLAEMASVSEVVLFVPNSEWANRYQRDLMGTGVSVMSTGGWNKKDPGSVSRALMAKRGVVVLSDEVHPWIADVVNKMKHNRFIVGYYSSSG